MNCRLKTTFQSLEVGFNSQFEGGSWQCVCRSSKLTSVIKWIGKSQMRLIS